MRKMMIILTACLAIASAFPAMSRTSVGEGDPIPIKPKPPGERQVGFVSVSYNDAIFYAMNL